MPFAALSPRFQSITGRWSVLLASVIFAAPTWSATYYLKPTGSDSSTKNGSSSQPWNSIGYAMSRMSTGDDLTLKEGTYYWGGQQNLTKGGSSSNQMIIQGESGKTVIINGQYAGTAGGIYGITSFVTVKNIRVTNYPNGFGIQLGGSSCIIDSCQVYDVGWTGIQIGYEITSWNNAPSNSMITGCSTWNCARCNDPSFWNYKNLRENNGGWSASISAVMCFNPVIKNCWAGGNWGEGIILSRVAGGNTEVANNYARDNYAANIYIDSTSGASDNWVSVHDNKAETTWDSAHYRSGSPAHNFCIAAEDYDGFLVGSNPSAYVSFDYNTANNGGHDFYVANYGKPVHDVVFNNNTASGSTWGNFQQDSGTIIYNIWKNGNTGF